MNLPSFVETVYLTLRVDLEPLAVNLATNGLVWQKSSVWIEYGCLGKPVQGSTLIEVGLDPGADADDELIKSYLLKKIKNYMNSDIISIKNKFLIYKSFHLLILKI